MPIIGNQEPPPIQPLYFKSLKELDDWIPGRLERHHDGILKYSPRSLQPTVDAPAKGKLLVCHDYKGGYTESLFSRSYTFNFWSTCDTFIYFSHHRVTTPPPGWINAAHRQGVKILGTLIFEGDGQEDCLRLVVGKMPMSTTGQVGKGTSSLTLPLSPHYARVLAELAKERGFDGYLLNVECPLDGGFEQTRALAAWITILQSEILERVGSHGQTIWYDSVVINGQLAWQDRLNSLNLPFFLSSTGFFSNYTWRSDYPGLTAQYFTTLDPSLIGNTSESHSQIVPKKMQDIYMGVDVWGRGSLGGGGFGCYKALTLIAPDTLGLSAALFGQAWTWESEQDKPDWTWDKWWEYETKLWVGPVTGTVEVPKDPNEPKDSHPGPFLPFVSFFPHSPPPDPAHNHFHTTFCPGTGLSWFVEGLKVYQSEKGWTDIDKQTSVGNMVWPRPLLYWDDHCEDAIPTALSAFCMDDAWNGGNSLRISISCPEASDELSAYRALWLPIQSLSITPQRHYHASIVFKFDGDLPQDVHTEIALVLKPPFGSSTNPAHLIFNLVSTTTTNLSRGWNKLNIQFTVENTNPQTTTDLSTLEIGLVIAILMESEDSTTKKPLEFSLLLGQLNVSTYLPPSFTEGGALVLWANYAQESITVDRAGGRPRGTLTWEVATSFPPVPKISITSPEDPLSAWNVQPTIAWFPSFLYFNIYAQLFTDQWNVGAVDQATWIGTTGWDGQKFGFDVIPGNLPFEVSPNQKVRFYVQGVTDRGDVLEWEKCAFVDASM